MSWWKFWESKKEERSEAEQQFQSQLDEALLRQDDLKSMARKMKEARIQRLATPQSEVHHRPKLNSQTSS